MKTSSYHITLLSDVILRADSATEGNSETLSYLPGATFLGVMARRLYDQLSPEDAFLLFHSGEVIFNDARPVLNTHECSIPTPLSLHYPKKTSRDQDQSIDYNFAHPDHRIQPNVQYKQRRQGHIYNHAEKTYIHPNLQVQSRARVALSKTPISGHQHHAQHQLYVYDSITAGTQFMWSIYFTTDRVQHLQSKIEASLQQNSMIHIGRSRSTEYGALRLTKAQMPSTAATTALTNHHQTLIFLALSDTVLRDLNTGAITLQATAQHFGLPEGYTLNTMRSFMRTRRYSPFNGKRQRNDLERQVITRGSVCVFESHNENALDLVVLQKKLAQGIGDFRETGLGQWMVNPSILTHTQVQIGEQKLNASPQKAKTQHAVMTWAKARHDEIKLKIDAGELSKQWETQLKPYCNPQSISRAQLGNLRLAGELFKGQSLYKQLFETEGRFSVVNDQGVRAVKWKSFTRKGKSAAEQLQACFDQNQDRPELWALTLQATASRLTKTLNREDHTQMTEEQNS